MHEKNQQAAVVIDVERLSAATIAYREAKKRHTEAVTAFDEAEAEKNRALKALNAAEGTLNDVFDELVAG